MDANYNLQALVAQVKDELQDESYNDARIIRYINQTYFEVFGELPYSFFEKVYKYETIDSGQMQLPNDFESMIKVVVELDKMKMPLRYLEPSKYFRAYEGEKVYRYTVIGNEVHFKLPDDFNCDGNDEELDDFYTLKLYYLAKPTKLTQSTDVPLIPSEYGEILILGALVRAERRRGNYDFAQIFENHKNELITNMAMRYGPRQLDGENRAVPPVHIRINEV